MTAGDYDEEEIKGQIDTLISENDVMMFSFSRCPFCIRSKQALSERGVEFKAIELDEMGLRGNAIRNELGRRTGRTSMPNIFIKGTGIGGCNDGTPGLMPLIAQDGLEELLSKA